MQLEPFADYAYERLGLVPDALDGPFLLPDGTFGILVSLRGKGGGVMPSPHELRWARDVPPRLRGEPAQVFFRKGLVATYLGAATLARRGRPGRDGFKVAFDLTPPLAEPLWREIVQAANAPLSPAPEAAIAALSSPSTTPERVAAMSVFLERWFGYAPAPSIASPALAPPPLRALHGTIGSRNPCAQNHLVPASRLEGEDGKVVFYVENQGVYRWATEPAHDDPPVFIKESGGLGGWRKESETLSEFLLSLLVFEAVLGAPFGAAQQGLDARSLARLTRRVVPLPIAPWGSSHHRFLGAGGVLGVVRPDLDGFDVWLGAMDGTRLEPLEDCVAEWETVRF